MGIVRIIRIIQLQDYVVQNRAALQPTYASSYYVYNRQNIDLSTAEISSILDKYFVYYKQLETQLQYKFYNRVISFMNAKNFIIHSQEPFKEMPVLISAAAVQISFGLADFELPHYTHIQVHQEEYFAENSLRILAGNVQGNCITLAWNHLINGYKNYTDGSNVALHEMAHALYFQEMQIERGEDKNFALNFIELMERCEDIIDDKKCEHNLYSNYAFTNLQEFWAVSVELFFEKPIELKKCYPEVFTELTEILKQNPLNVSNPIV